MVFDSIKTQTKKKKKIKKRRRRKAAVLGFSKKRKARTVKRSPEQNGASNERAKPGGGEQRRRQYVSRRRFLRSDGESVGAGTDVPGARCGEAGAAKKKQGDEKFDLGMEADALRGGRS